MSNSKSTTVINEKPGEFTVQPLQQSELFSFDPRGAHPEHINQFNQSLDRLQKAVDVIKMGQGTMFSIQTIWHHLPAFKRQEIGDLANEHFQGDYKKDYFSLTYGQKLHVLGSLYVMYFIPKDFDNQQ